MMNNCLRVLVTGASGLLGKYLMKVIRASDVEVHGTWFTSAMPSGYRLDITDKKMVDRIFMKLRPHIVIHCAAIGSVDYCETHWHEAHVTNVVGTQKILEAANEYRAKFVYISSNAVYDGRHPPYNEESPRNPVNVYGRLKRDAEDVVMSAECYVPPLIIRPIMLYGWPRAGGRGNWVVRIIDMLWSGRGIIEIVDDTVTQPTYARDCAITIWELIHMEHNGQFNIGGMDRMSLYEMTRMVADVWELKKNLIIPIKSSKLKDIAPRPVDTTYDLTKLYDLGIDSLRPSGLQNGLERMKKEKCI